MNYCLSLSNNNKNSNSNNNHNNHNSHNSHYSHYSYYSHYSHYSNRKKFFPVIESSPPGLFNQRSRKNNRNCTHTSIFVVR